MTLAHRRIIYSIFIVAFLVILPLIILHSTGYRFNSKKSILQKTGIIFLESKPKDVDIFINGKIVENRSPVRIKNLLPNKYDIRISKEGYMDWQKRVDVYDGQTTFLQYVRLFKDNGQPGALISGDILEMQKGKNDNALLLKELRDGYELALYDFESNEELIIFESNVELSSFKFVENDNKVLVRTGGDYWLIDTAEPEERVYLNDKIGESFENLKLDEFNSNFIFYQSLGQLKRLNLSDDSIYELEFYPIDYLVRGDEFYLLTEDSLNSIFLKKFRLADSTQPEVLLSLSTDSDYKLEYADDSFVLIFNDDRLIVLDQEEKSKEVIAGVDYYEWNGSKTEFLFGNDFELWSYRPYEEYDKYILFTRTGEDIKMACWYKPDTHLFFVADNNIKVIENLVSDRVVNEIIGTDRIDFAAANKKGDKLYFVGQVGGDNGLFEIQILDD
jgi:hypothetical protein